LKIDKLLSTVATSVIYFIISQNATEVYRFQWRKASIKKQQA